MVSTLLILLAAWAVTVPAVLGAARLLGRWSTPRVESRVGWATAAPPEESDGAGDNVVPLVPRPRNRLAPADRRAA
jgi:hypothetical protein